MTDVTTEPVGGTGGALEGTGMTAGANDDAVFGWTPGDGAEVPNLFP